MDRTRQGQSSKP